MHQHFVVLQHETAEKVHWDLMLEQGDALLTWSLPPRPMEKSGQRLADFQCQASRLPDHRKIYLDYEGPLSGHRGTVRKIDAGTYEQDELGRFCLSGTVFFGIISFSDLATHENSSKEPGTKRTRAVPESVVNPPITLTYKSMP